MTWTQDPYVAGYEDRCRGEPVTFIEELVVTCGLGATALMLARQQWEQGWREANQDLEEGGRDIRRMAAAVPKRPPKVVKKKGRPTLPPGPPQKECKVCKRVLPNNTHNFYKTGKVGHRLSALCIRCANDRQKVYNERSMQRILEKSDHATQALREAREMPSDQPLPGPARN